MKFICVLMSIGIKGNVVYDMKKNNNKSIVCSVLN